MASEADIATPAEEYALKPTPAATFVEVVPDLTMTITSTTTYTRYRSLQAVPQPAQTEYVMPVPASAAPVRAMVATACLESTVMIYQTVTVKETVTAAAVTVTVSALPSRMVMPPTPAYAPARLPAYVAAYAPVPNMPRPAVARPPYAMSNSTIAGENLESKPSGARQPIVPLATGT
jgi:hypothetical protein